MKRRTSMDCKAFKRRGQCLDVQFCEFNCKGVAPADPIWAEKGLSLRLTEESASAQSWPSSPPQTVCAEPAPFGHADTKRQREVKSRPVSSTINSAR